MKSARRDLSPLPTFDDFRVFCSFFASNFDLELVSESDEVSDELDDDEADLATNRWFSMTPYVEETSSPELSSSDDELPDSLPASLSESPSEGLSEELPVPSWLLSLSSLSPATELAGLVAGARFTSGCPGFCCFDHSSYISTRRGRPRAAPLKGKDDFSMRQSIVKALAARGKSLFLRKVWTRSSSTGEG